MPDFSRFYGANRMTLGDPIVKAIYAHTRILAKPTAVTLVRNGVTLASQQVRIEFDSFGASIMTDVGRPAEQRAVVYGVVGHPTIVNTDIQKGDRFILSGKEYTVDQTITLPGEIQAFARVNS